MAEAAKSPKPNLKKYKRQPKAKVEPEKGTIMVAGAGPPSQYISSVLDAFDGGASTVTLLGRGNAIGKSRQICEVVRRRIKGLHSIKEATSEVVTDTYVAKDEKSGLEPVTWEHKVSGVKVVLSTTALDTAAKGYQKPIDDDKIIAEDKSKREERGKKTPGRGRGRGKGKGKKGGRGRGSAKKDEFAWLPVRRGGKGGAPGRGGARGLPSRGGGRNLPSRGGGGRVSRGGGGRAPPRSRGGGGFGGGLARSRGAGSRPYSAGGGRRAAPVRSRGGGGGRAPAVRSRGAGGFGGAPRSRGGGGYAGPPRSRGGAAARRYAN